MRRTIRKALKAMMFGSLLFLAACGKENTKNEAVSPIPALAVTNTVAPTAAPVPTVMSESTATPSKEPTATEIPTKVPTITSTVTPEPTVTPTTDIPLTRENFPDVNFRLYLSEYVDINQDWILSLEERESVIRIQNEFADYDKAAWWNDGNSDVAYRDDPAILKRCAYIDEFSNLQGIEYFPNLFEIQLDGMEFDTAVTELVVTNPKLEVFDLRYRGNLEIIDLTACESLKTCVIECREETDPEILLPEPLEVTKASRYACVVGETAWEWLIEYYAGPTLVPPCPPEELPEEDYAIVWTNEKLEEAIRKLTGVRDRDIMLSDVYNITELNLRIRWLSGMGDLTHFKNLKALRLWYSYITDISGLAELKNLEKLDLENNQIEDISALAELPNLKVLWLRKNKLMDISPLASMSNLTELNLSFNRIVDISPLAGLPKLEKLIVNSNPIENIDGLCGMESLIELEAAFNQIERVQLSGLPKLQRLDLGYNKIKEITLSDMPELWELQLWNNNITDVSGLAGLESLREAHLSSNPVKNIEVLGFVEKVTYDKVEVTMTPVPTATPEPTSTPVSTSTPEPTPLPTVTATPAPTSTPTPTPSPTPAGAIALNASHFPDEAFLSFLSTYVDADKDGILTKKERDNLIAIDRNDCLADSGYLTEEEKDGMWEAHRAVRSFEGIEQFEKVKRMDLGDSNQTINKLSVNNPELEDLWMISNSIQEVSVQNVPKLKKIVISTENADLQSDFAWESFENLEELRVDYVKVDMAALTQIETLTSIDLEYCDVSWPESKVDFSKLTELEYFDMCPSQKKDVRIVDCLDFSGCEKLSKVRIVDGVAREIILPSRDVTLYYWPTDGAEHCQFTFADDIEPEFPAGLQEGDVLLNAENFPDEFFRQYLFLYVDANQDNVLSLAERESVVRIKNDFADYDESAGWNEANSDSAYEGPEIDKMVMCLENMKNLQGMEHFPNLYEIQLVGLHLDTEIRELVLANPNLEIFDLRYQGKLETIDLTACEKLRTCVVNCRAEVKPSILLPEPLTVTPARGYDCVVGETAWEWLVGDSWVPTPTPLPPELLPGEDYAIAWTNDKLEEIVRDKTEIRYRDVMLSDVYHITELQLNYRGLTDISDLAHLKNLKVLSLCSNKITDISPLAGLLDLEELELDNNKLEDISVLAGLSNLKELSLRGNQLVDISPLASLSNLTRLNLIENQVTDVSPLAGLTKLEKLYLSSNQIQTIDCLQGMESLVYLVARKNQIETVHLSGLPKLQELDLNKNQIREIVLSDLPMLQELSLVNNSITDVSGLAGLHSLKTLDLQKNPVENIELVEFVENLKHIVE